MEVMNDAIGLWAILALPFSVIVSIVFYIITNKDIIDGFLLGLFLHFGITTWIVLILYFMNVLSIVSPVLIPVFIAIAVLFDVGLFQFIKGNKNKEGE